jgi:hypothetical protein
MAAVTSRLSKIRNGWYGGQIAAAIAIARAAGMSNSILTHFEEIYRASDRWLNRLRLAGFFLAHGRRRLADRAVMAGSALAGWIQPATHAIK